VEQGNDLGQGAADFDVLAGLENEGAVQFDDFRADAPHPVEIGVTGAEVVQGDEAAQLPEKIHGLAELCVFPNRLFQHFDHQTVGGNVQGVKKVEQEARVMNLGRLEENLGMHIQEQPVAAAVLLGVIGHMHDPGKPVQVVQVVEITGGSC